MRIELVNTGTELLLGDVVNTNAAWIGQQLAALGLSVQRQTIVPDGPSIGDVLAEAATRCDIIMVTGGLGPTNDDVSREVTAGLLGLPMDLDEGVMGHLQDYMRTRGKEVNDATRRQAMVPRGATVLNNGFGTAPGLYLSSDLAQKRDWNCHFFLLPGPPRELKPMVETEVLPILKQLVQTHADYEIVYQKVTGMGESDLVDHIEADLEAMVPEGLIMGYCLGHGDVDVRLSGPSAVVQRAAALVRERIGPSIISEDRKVMEEVVVDLLKQNGETVAVAESCTGGYIAHRLTNVSGASAVLGFGFVTYANEAKTRVLGVDAALIEKLGAVSDEVARAMAEGCLTASGADHAIAVTGIAGPTGGSVEKPVGTVYVAVASAKKTTICHRLFFPVTRDRFKMLTSQWALDFLRRRLLDIEIAP